jgi:hypothetical protein
MDKRRSPRRLEGAMSASRCGLNSAAAGSFRDQSWRSSGDFGLSIQNANIQAPAIFFAPSWLQMVK